MYIQEGIRKLRWEGRRGGRREGEELDLSPLEFFTGRNKKKERKEKGSNFNRTKLFLWREPKYSYSLECKKKKKWLK